KAIVASGDISHGTVIRGDHLPQILGVEPRGELGRADQIAEHHSQLPALGDRSRPSLSSKRVRVREGAAQRSYCFEKLAAMDPQHHTEILQILVRKFGQRLPIDLMIAKGGLVTIEAETLQPRRDIHACRPYAALLLVSAADGGRSVDLKR